MKKRIMAFYDVLLYAIICSPLIVIAVTLLFMLVTQGTSAWICENWYLVLIFAITFTIPLGGTMMLRCCLIRDNTIRFVYFPFTLDWEKATNNIDIRWNQEVFISEVLTNPTAITLTIGCISKHSQNPTSPAIFGTPIQFP